MIEKEMVIKLTRSPEHREILDSLEDRFMSTAQAAGDWLNETKNAAVSRPIISLPLKDPQQLTVILTTGETNSKGVRTNFLGHLRNISRDMLYREFAAGYCIPYVPDSVAIHIDQAPLTHHRHHHYPHRPSP